MAEKRGSEERKDVEITELATIKYLTPVKHCSKICGNLEELYTSVIDNRINIIFYHFTVHSVDYLITNSRRFHWNFSFI